MPSTKKRVNLTIPDELYNRLQSYKTKNGLVNDATACMQLIVQQLNALEKTDIFMDFVRNHSIEQLNEMAKEGFSYVKSTQDSVKAEQLAKQD